ncbi:MAG: nickel-dependent hydrogenase large subunit [Hyphomicrobium sp.]
MRTEGRLDITIVRAGQTPRVTISSSRPHGLARTLIGMKSEQVVATIPLLYSVCGMAQGAAAAQAVSAASGVCVPNCLRTARRLLILAEASREHLIACARDWAQLAGDNGSEGDSFPILRTYQKLQRAIDCGNNALRIGADVDLNEADISAAISELDGLIHTSVLGEPCAQFLDRTTASAFDDWAADDKTPAQKLATGVLRAHWAHTGSTTTRSLPRGCASPLASDLLSQRKKTFTAMPEWEGGCCETTALSRQSDQALIKELYRAYGSGLLTRIAARLIDLALLPQIMRRTLANVNFQDVPWLFESNHFATECGVSEVETVRGRLIHAVRIQQDIVRNYAILAPTEWNFHPAGIAADALMAMASGKNIAERAKLFLAVLDPCVAFDVRVA